MAQNLTIDRTRHTPEELEGMIATTQGAPSVADFHSLWYGCGHTWAMTRYLGIPILKNPLDLQVYADILWSVKPRVIIETGTCFGASALWFAHQLERIHPDGNFRVVTIDVEDRRRDGTETGDDNYTWAEPRHDGILWVHGSSTVAMSRHIALSTIRTHGGPVLVSLDSDHRMKHVAHEMELYAPMVTPGSFLVVEDTNMDGRPIQSEGNGPGKAVDDFLVHTDEFRPSLLCERYVLTMFPGGWLQRVKGG